MTIPSGVQKQFIIGKEGASTWGAAAGAGTGKKMRRVQGNMTLVKGAYESEEIRSDQQVVDMRHGMRHVEGNLEGELSCKSYQDLFAAALRAAWVAGSTTGAQINISSAANTFTRASGSFITDGFKVGDLVLVSGFNTTSANGQFIITALSATVMTVDGANIGTDAGGESVTIAVDGRKLQVPSSAHTNDSFTIEELYEMGATDISELSVGNRVTGFSINAQPDGTVRVSFKFMGKDMTSDATPYFTSPADEDSTGVKSGSSGTIYKDGVAIAVLTSFQLEMDGGGEVGAVIGSNVPPDVFVGRIRVSGSLSSFFLNESLWQALDDESELSLVFRLTSGVDKSLIINLPRVKFSTNAKDDKEVGGTVEATEFTALKYVGSGNFDSTTLVLQDTEVTTS